MPGCSAWGCTNRRENGLKLYYLPSGLNDVERRIVWLHRISRKDFQPTRNTALCQVHFEPNQFESRIPDKLKPNAVPSIFPHRDYIKHRKLPKKWCQSSIESPIGSCSYHSYSKPNYEADVLPHCDKDSALQGGPADTADINHPDWIPTQNMGYGKKSYKKKKSSNKKIKFRKPKQKIKKKLPIPEEACESKTNLRESLLVLAKTYIGENDYSTAISLIDRAVVLSATNDDNACESKTNLRESLLVLAKTYISENDYSTAISLIDRAVVLPATNDDNDETCLRELLALQFITAEHKT